MSRYRYSVGIIYNLYYVTIMCILKLKIISPLNVDNS